MNKYNSLIQLPRQIENKKFLTKMNFHIFFSNLFSDDYKKHRIVNFFVLKKCAMEEKIIG
ncbi:hypothetical protein BpHYR1_009146 [Brachionus plicatilis]|uniref:Uncharacterized protein n=1 Tax=Brachionus plicatilis TaxID=10195 RepID=A0A3M7RLT7_BRAPC|nr:hypothetical protein BpHYR1_009146 [Brachionus plicatilis]